MVEGLIRYVRVAWPDKEYNSWYKDENSIAEIDDWVLVDRSWEKDIIAEVKEVRHCLASEPPCKGRIKSINSLYKKADEIERIKR